ncbi:MAG: monovalent cation:proton antiporter-2 (CPA2) family protein [Pseudomonadota bacterium]
MAGTPVDPFLVEAATLLGAAVVAVPIAKRLGLGSVLGYLAAGVIIGPFGLGLISGAKDVLHFAEFGVVILLFVIGLELHPSRLWRLRADIFGLGALQVGATGAVISAALWLGGVANLLAALALGLALALSSTAFAVQLMRDRGELAREHGQRALSILLFQDLAIVPLLAFVALIAPGSEGESFDHWALLRGVAALAAVLLIGRFGLNPIFRLLARTGADETFTAAALMIVVGSALLMQMAGLSMALGAFLAGVLLAESEFRHQLETDIEPFRGLLLGLFFMAVGMGINLPVVLEAVWLILGAALALYLGKAAIIFLLCRSMGSTVPDGIRVASILGQGGEFGFVVFGAGAALQIWPDRVESILAAIVAVTMLMTPLVVKYADTFAQRFTRQDMDGIDDVERAGSAPIIVAGFGRFGQIIARVLKLRGYDVTLIDNDPNRIRIAETFGNKVFFGDLRRGHILRAAGAEEARAIFVCVDDPKTTLLSVEALRRRFPGKLLFARAADRFAEIELTKSGADGVIREMAESAIELSRRALVRLGEGDAASETIAEFRRRDAELLRLQSEFGAHGGYERLRKSYSLQEER